MPSMVNPAPNDRYHSFGCGRTQVAMSPMASTTDPMVCRPPMAGGSGWTCGAPPGPWCPCSTTPVDIRLRPLRLRHVGVRVADRGQVGGPRHGVQLGEQAVVGRLLLPDVDAALRVTQVAEHNGPGRARGLARRHHLAVADRPALPLGLDLGGPDPLHAVRALLHHPPLADRYLRVPHELVCAGLEV